MPQRMSREVLYLFRDQQFDVVDTSEDCRQAWPGLELRACQASQVLHYGCLARYLGSYPNFSEMGPATPQFASHASDKRCAWTPKAFSSSTQSRLRMASLSTSKRNCCHSRGYCNGLFPPNAHPKTEVGIEFRHYRSMQPYREPETGSAGTNAEHVRIWRSDDMLLEPPLAMVSFG